ncbi:MAG: ECF transporter S component, partial [Candidatus Izimaplasma sp.]|nr:ECF transporter S component [Candidatus Izimaplasma bacterium]
MFKFETKTIVATGLGAALFMLLFMFVKIPSPIPETSFQTAYGLGAFFAVIFGPIAGGLIAFIGHGLSDAIQYGS